MCVMNCNEKEKKNKQTNKTQQHSLNVFSIKPNGAIQLSYKVAVNRYCVRKLTLVTYALSAIISLNLPSVCNPKHNS